MRLPDYAREEWGALPPGEDPRTVWASGDTSTAFRRDQRPYRDHDDPAFRIVVPVSGGLDSGTCYRMAVAAGLPVEPVMVDTGVSYARHDRAAAEELTGGRLTVLPLPETPSWETIQEVQLGRNSIIMWTIARWARENGWWGELWFGNLGGNYLETPVVGGDKSFRWLGAMQHFLTASGFDLRLTSPLIGLSKADLVTWWEGRGELPAALALRSCFVDQPEQCGHCWACLYRYVAFAARGHADAVTATYPHGIDFTVPALDFWGRAASLPGVTTAPSRLTEVLTVLEGLGLGPAFRDGQEATQPDGAAYRPAP